MYTKDTTCRCDMCNMCGVSKMAVLKSAEITPSFLVCSVLMEYKKDTEH